MAFRRSGKYVERLDRGHRMMKQALQDRTGRTGQLQEIQERPARQEGQDKTAGKGQPAHKGKKKAAKTEQAEWDRQAGTGRPGQAE